MYVIKCNPVVNDAHVFKFNDEEGAIDAAMKMAKKYNTQITIMKEIRIIKLEAVEEEI